MNILFNANPKFISWALLFLRIGIGSSVIYFHGYDKLIHSEDWSSLGETMGNFGIHFAPKFWGFMAAFAEFFGSVFLILGLFTRPAAFLLAFSMCVAAFTLFTDAEPYSYALDLCIVYLFILLSGAGKYSLDAKIGGFKK